MYYKIKNSASFRYFDACQNNDLRHTRTQSTNKYITHVHKVLYTCGVCTSLRTHCRRLLGTRITVAVSRAHHCVCCTNLCARKFQICCARSSNISQSHSAKPNFDYIPIQLPPNEQLRLVAIQSEKCYFFFWKVSFFRKNVIFFSQSTNLSPNGLIQTRLYAHFHENIYCRIPETTKQ